ncbi:MAG: electron transfer flavoprotein subunit alpha/FixB family protein [Hyphomicrobiaceae bacterium]|nr:electron transfer flavoprotein subunit alpha/FixB family protein [Hyphomicrobiaceae bacterium]
MRTLVVAEHDNSNLAEATSRMVAAAIRLGSEVDVLVAGNGCANAAGEVSAFHGVDRVLVAEDPSLEHRLAEPLADLVFWLAVGYGAILAPATSFGKNVLPRVAALLDVMQISDVIEIVDASTFRRPIYAGNAIETVRSDESKKLLTVRPTAFPPAKSGGAARIEQVEIPDLASPTTFVRLDAASSDRPELGSARIVVSGGRALGSREEFERLILPLADKLGAAVGASRAAVDSGFVSNDCQVGQTGKIVAPELYFACGISGAIQHLAGMKDSRVIVAINKDEDAPIFAVADFGLVGDLFELLPELTQKL